MNEMGVERMPAELTVRDNHFFTFSGLQTLELPRSHRLATCRSAKLDSPPLRGYSV